MFKIKSKKRFTLMEMVIVIAIIALLAAIVTPMYFNHVKKARIEAVKMQIKMFEQSIQDYQLDTGKLPSSLNDLISNISGSPKWGGPYLQATAIPQDPWGNNYVYTVPGTYGPFDLYSYGPNGPSSGGDSSTIIGNWNMN